MNNDIDLKKISKYGQRFTMIFIISLIGTIVIWIMFIRLGMHMYFIWKEDAGNEIPLLSIVQISAYILILTSIGHEWFYRSVNNIYDTEILPRAERLVRESNDPYCITNAEKEYYGFIDSLKYLIFPIDEAMFILGIMNIAVAVKMHMYCFGTLGLSLQWW